MVEFNQYLEGTVEAFTRPQMEHADDAQDALSRLENGSQHVCFMIHGNGKHVRDLFAARMDDVRIFVHNVGSRDGQYECSVRKLVA